MNIFKDKSVKIYNETGPKILEAKPTILSGTKNTPQQHFCSINLPQKSPTLHQYNASIGNPTTKDRISFFHSTMFYPTLPNWCNSIDDGLLTT